MSTLARTNSWVATGQGERGRMLNSEVRLRWCGDLESHVLHVAEVVAGKTAG